MGMDSLCPHLIPPDVAGDVAPAGDATPPPPVPAAGGWATATARLQSLRMGESAARCGWGRGRRGTVGAVEMAVGGGGAIKVRRAKKRRSNTSGTPFSAARRSNETRLEAKAGGGALSPSRKQP